MATFTDLEPETSFDRLIGDDRPASSQTNNLRLQPEELVNVTSTETLPDTNRITSFLLLAAALLGTPIAMELLKQFGSK